MRNIGSKINQFENGNTNVLNFNNIFSDCKLRGFNDNDIVEIGEIHSSGTTRYIKVNDTTKIINLAGENDRKPNISNPLVVLYNSDGELTFNSKLKAIEFLGITEGFLNILRTYDETYKGYYVEYKDKNND